MHVATQAKQIIAFLYQKTLISPLKQMAARPMPPSISVLQPSHSRHQVSFAPRASYGVSNCYCRDSPPPSARLFEEFFNIHGLFPTSNGSHKELRLLQQFRCYRWCNFCTTD